MAEYDIEYDYINGLIVGSKHVSQYPIGKNRVKSQLNRHLPKVISNIIMDYSEHYPENYFDKYRTIFRNMRLHSGDKIIPHAHIHRALANRDEESKMSFETFDLEEEFDTLDPNHWITNDELNLERDHYIYRYISANPSELYYRISCIESDMIVNDILIEPEKLAPLQQDSLEYSYCRFGMPPPTQRLKKMARKKKPKGKSRTKHGY